MAERVSSRPMFVLLVILVFVNNFGVGIYRAGGTEPPPELELLYTAAFTCGVVWWFRAEVSRHSLWPVYCPGLLLYVGWIIIIPYHLLKTRGAKGLLPLLVLFGSFVAAHILATLLLVILSGQS